MTTEQLHVEDPPQKGDASATAPVEPTGRHRRWRGPLASFLGIVAALSLVLAVSASWMRTTLMDTDSWVGAMGPLPEDEEFRALLATEVTTHVFELIDLPTLLGEELGPVGRALAGPIEDTTAQYVERATERAIATPAFEEIWVDVNRRAHTVAVRVLRGDTENLTTVDGTVVLDLVPIISLVVADVSNNAAELFGGSFDLPEIAPDQVQAATAQLSTALGIELPPDFGQVPLFEEAELERARQPVRILDDGVVALWVIFALSVVGALVASPNRRRTVAILGIATSVAATLAWLVRSPIEQSIVDQIESPSGRQAAAIVIETALWRNLGRLIVLLLIVSLITAAVAFVTGPSSTALSIRRTVRGLFGGDSEAQTPVSRFMRRHVAGFRVAGAVLAIIGMLSLQQLTWGWFFAISIVLVAYELSWEFVAPEGADGPDPESPAGVVSSPG